MQPAGNEELKANARRAYDEAVAFSRYASFLNVDLDTNFTIVKTTTRS